MSADLRETTRAALEAIEQRAQAAARTAGEALDHAELFVAADGLSRLARLARRAQQVAGQAPGAAPVAFRHLAGQASLLSLSAAALAGEEDNAEARRVGVEIRQLARECQRLAARREF